MCFKFNPSIVSIIKSIKLNLSSLFKGVLVHIVIGKQDY
ncbi:hypothetical protein P20495_2721 [Pseudoalteromonas sp. BSi20495]|nr:hypothetical protein P20495_2721 [Pseudoalteromonas sp. BSi20495]